MCLWEMKRSRRLLETSPPQNTSHPWTEWQFFSSESTLFFCSSLLALWRSVSINLRVLALDTSRRPCPSSWLSSCARPSPSHSSGRTCQDCAWSWPYTSWWSMACCLGSPIFFLGRKSWHVILLTNGPNSQTRVNRHPSCTLSCWNGGRIKKIAFDEGFVFIFSTKRWYLCQNWPTYWSLNLT